LTLLHERILKVVKDLKDESELTELWQINFIRIRAKMVTQNTKLIDSNAKFSSVIDKAFVTT